MKTKPVVPRALAGRDIDAAVDYYAVEGGAKAAMGFIAALEAAFRHIARHPASASARYGDNLDLPGLRTWPLKRYPYFIFFVERDAFIDVWRVLHGARDIPTSLKDPDGLI